MDDNHPNKDGRRIQRFKVSQNTFKMTPGGPLTYGRLMGLEVQNLFKLMGQSNPILNTI